jgi:methionyl aminopeptidase
MTTTSDVDNIEIDHTADLEAVGASFTIEQQLDVRARTHVAVHAIAAKVAAGMVEEDAVAMARELLGTMNMRKGWHRVIVRFGSNTTKDFEAASEPGVVLGDSDIFFVDIGPVHDGCEGDAGETFVLGEDPEHHKAKRDVRALWDDVREVWFRTGATGRELYEYATKKAADMGWVLNLDLSGHRLSEFPHETHYAGGLADVDLHPKANLWVLEMAIRHPERPFGAFYEDLLLEDQSHTPV